MTKPRMRKRLGATNTAILNGEVDLKEWDEEELIRGRPRDKRGTFRGRPPTLLPREVYAELRHRTLTEFHEKVRANVLPAMDALAAMALGELEPDPARIKAIQEIINRFAGKAPERVDVAVTEVKPWEIALQGIARDAGDDDHEIIDAEVLDDDDEPW